jgi:hypothetical protein
MTTARTFGVRNRIVELLAGRDDVVWTSLQSLGDAALVATQLVEQGVHHGRIDARLRQELTATGERTDETLRGLNRHLHNSFTAPLERDDAIALATAFDRIAQTSADIGAALGAAGEERGPYEARRATSLLASALECLVTALGDLAAGRATSDAPAEARERLRDARDFVRRGRGDMLSAQLPVEQLLSLKDLYDRLEIALAAARDVERLEDAIELRGPSEYDESAASQERSTKSATKPGSDASEEAPAWS